MLGWIAGLLGVSEQAILVKLLGILALTVTIPALGFLAKKIYDESGKRTERRRNLYAEALSACQDYREFVYVIYRRGMLNPEAERLRISEALRDIQRRIAYHESWLKVESKAVSAEYAKLVKRLRDVAGAQMKKAWRAQPITEDKDMSIRQQIDWQDLDRYTDGFVEVARRELVPWWNIKQRYFND